MSTPVAPEIEVEIQRQETHARSSPHSARRFLAGLGVVLVLGCVAGVLAFFVAGESSFVVSQTKWALSPYASRGVYYKDNQREGWAYGDSNLRRQGVVTGSRESYNNFYGHPYTGVYASFHGDRGLLKKISCTCGSTSLNEDFIGSCFRPALQRRSALIEILHAEDTTCYRLFHGTNEGAPGLTIDRYGEYLLVQTWRETIELSLLGQLASAVESEFGLKLTPVWNHRAKRGAVDHSLHSIEIPSEATGQEMGLTYEVAPRHRGIDPLLFLDFRAGRRKIKSSCADKTVLNLFSYTCGIGVVAATAGAREVINVDFSEFALQIGHMNALKNGISGLSEVFTTIHEDAIPIMLQYSGLGVRGRRGQLAKRSFKKVDARQFDVVVLDPPRYAKSPFGVVDAVGDYQSIFKPALLSTRSGGHMLVTNNVASVTRDEFKSMLERCAKKAGRPISAFEYLDIEADFPSPDGQWPLKMAWIEVA